MKFSVMLGVAPGYDANAPVEENVKIAKQICKEKDSFRFASAVYNTQWGCPPGGEPGVVIEGEISGEQRKSLEESISVLMGALGQSTSMMEYQTENGQYFSTYIQNTYENEIRDIGHISNTTYTENKEQAIHFEFGIKKSDYFEVGKILQDQMNQVTGDEYTIMGVLSEYTNKNGEVTLIYGGSQNPQFAPDNKKYFNAIEKVAKTLANHNIDITSYKINGQLPATECLHSVGACKE